HHELAPAFAERGQIRVFRVRELSPSIDDGRVAIEVERPEVPVGLGGDEHEVLHQALREVEVGRVAAARTGHDEIRPAAVVLTADHEAREERLPAAGHTAVYLFECGRFGRFQLGYVA